MSPKAREDFLDEANMALGAETLRLAEGSPHIESKFAAFQVLRDHFNRIGRQIYIKPELAVHYPGSPVFAPDLLAVLDVADPGIADTRTAWVVVEERKGIDLVLEVLHLGDRRKDLFDNVTTFAGHGISEYFVYDRLKQRLHGWRLPTPYARTYQPIPPRGGAFRSAVLGLDLEVAEERLCFSDSGSRILSSTEMVARLHTIVDELSQRADAEAARAESEAARAETEAARAEAAERRIAELLARLGES